MKDILIIGAGPYGLTLAALAKTLKLDFDLVGMPMSLWREHMPKGLILRTGKDEHFDVEGVHTMDAFVNERGVSDDEIIPLPLSRYLEYAEWFTRKKDLFIINDLVRTLTIRGGGFLAELIGGRKISANKVIVAIGIADAKYIPIELSALVPPGRFSHSSDQGDLGCFRDKSVLIVGGRQSAFETAVLLAEEGARSVNVVCRHPTPRFTCCDFSFMHEFINKVEMNPAWYRTLSDAEKYQWNKKAFEEGRLKLEHWLEPRLKAGNVIITENTNLVKVELAKDQMCAYFDNHEEIDCDHIIFATGFKPDISRISFLKRGGLIEKIKVQAGSPVLDNGFQSSQKGLYFIGMLAMADFGYSFGFATGAQTAAKIILRSKA